jgi:putative heme-binding domain-containing protein
LLVGLRSESVLEKTLDLLLQGATQEEEFQYAKTLMHRDGPWSRDEAEKMLEWFSRSRRYRGGRSVETVWNQLHERFMEKLSEEQQSQFADRIALLSQPEVETTEATIVPRAFVQEWQLDDLLEDVLSLDRQVASERTQEQPAGRQQRYQDGIQALEAGACLKCHQYGGRGTHVGPDLTSVGKRFDGRALLESILEPSRQIDPKYLSTSYLLANGQVVSGRTVGVSRSQLVIEVDALTGRTETVERSQIEQSSPAEISPMPQGLLNTMTRAEVLALIRLLREGL